MDVRIHRGVEIDIGDVATVLAKKSAPANEDAFDEIRGQLGG